MGSVCNGSIIYSLMSIKLHSVEFGNDTVITVGTFTPTLGDKDGFNVKCTDTKHTNWKGGNTEMSVKVEPSCK